MTTLPPVIRAGLTAQLDHWRAALAGGAQRVGWKMGRGIEEVEALMGAAPVIGHLTTLTQLEPGAVHDARGAGALRAEAELALVVGDDVPPDAELRSARAAIAGLAVALELVDVGPPRGDVERVLANNAFHRAFALGPVEPAGTTAGRAAKVVVDGAVRGTGELLDEYADTIRDAAAVLGALGERLLAGDVVIAGSAVHVPVSAGEQVSAQIEGLGRVGATVAA